jgi:hypothetical protein
MFHLSVGVEALIDACDEVKEGDTPMSTALETAITIFGPGTSGDLLSNDISTAQSWDQGLGLGDAVEILTLGIKGMHGADMEKTGFGR